MNEQFFLTLRTSLSGQTLERLLAGACRHGYSIGFEGTEETDRGERKIIRLGFGNTEDRERFRAHLRQLATIAPAPQRLQPKPAMAAIY